MHGVPTHFLGVLAEVDMRSRRGENVDMSSLRCVEGFNSYGRTYIFSPTYLILERELLLVLLSP